MTDPVFHWWYSNNEETYQGPCGSREEAISTGFHEYGGEGTLFIVEATQATPGTDIFDFDRVLEDFEERNEECWGEEGEPISQIDFKDKRQLENMLSATLRNYLERNNALRSWAFGQTRNAETINMEAGGYIESYSFQSIMISAFRYALGRKTYVVSETVGVLIDQWDRLGHAQDIILKEIQEAIDAGKSGMDMDVAQWARILAHDEEEKKKVLKARQDRRDAADVGVM